MPQIWMTYEEAGRHLGCGDREARAHAIEAGWVRKRSRDGQSRMKLPDAEVHAYLEAYFKARLAELLAPADAVHDMQRRVQTLEAELSKAA